MDRGINRVAPGIAYPARAVPKAKERRESEDPNQFERELSASGDQDTTDREPNTEHAESNLELHISPPADDEPGNILDLTA